ncbi:MAG: nucleotide exchange factor GrpE [Candidatus Glassbacteria bacterium]|nr:nucleotide exchange factor GrpE [Candidatus Glassbacteria bacterium]
MTKADKKKKSKKPVETENAGVEVEVSTETDAEQPGGELDEALAKIGELEQELADATDKHLRAVAELDNFKRRTAKEKSELAGYVKAGVFRDILGLVDAFERFFQHVENSQSELDGGFVQGVELMHKTLQKVLAQHGVEAVNETGVPVDYNLHEAVMTEPVDDEKQDQAVVEILEVGYKIGDKLIRPAKVKVGVFDG